MRQIFKSQRLENVEGVARLLNDHGIETHTESGRSYKGKHRGHFSYVDQQRAAQPSVWIVNSEDQTRARQLLREAGLIDSTRADGRQELPAPVRRSAITPIAMRIRMILLIVIAVMAGMTSARMVGWL